MLRPAIVAVSGLLLAWALSAGAGQKASTYYVQLIRCSDQEKAPEPGCHRVGPKLSERFQCVFGCKSYWEICQEKVEVLPDRVAKVELRNGRSVEIDLTHAGKRRVAAYCKGRLIDRTVEPSGENMTLIGG